MPALPDTDVYRVRGVEGVEWAVRLYYGQDRAGWKMATFAATCCCMASMTETMVAAPQQMVVGKLDELRNPMR